MWIICCRATRRTCLSSLWWWRGNTMPSSNGRFSSEWLCSCWISQIELIWRILLNPMCLALLFKDLLIVTWTLPQAVPCLLLTQQLRRRTLGSLAKTKVSSSEWLYNPLWTKMKVGDSYYNHTTASSLLAAACFLLNLVDLRIYCVVRVMMDMIAKEIRWLQFIHAFRWRQTGSRLPSALLCSFASTNYIY